MIVFIIFDTIEINNIFLMSNYIMKISEAIIFIFNWFKSFIKNHPILSALLLVLFVLFWFIVGIIILIVLAILLAKKKKKDKIKKYVTENVPNENKSKSKKFVDKYKSEKKFPFGFIVEGLYKNKELKNIMNMLKKNMDISKKGKITYDLKKDTIKFDINLSTMKWNVNLGKIDEVVINKIDEVVINKIDEINKIMNFYERVPGGKNGKANKYLKENNLRYIYVLILYFVKYDIEVKNEEGLYLLPHLHQDKDNNNKETIIFLKNEEELNDYKNDPKSDWVRGDYPYIDDNLDDNGKLIKVI
jgi:hypothetical protein